MQANTYILILNLSDVILITGGYGSLNTAELYLPSSGLSCSLPRLPDARLGHTQDSSGLLCGGGYTEGTCIQWSPDTGIWVECLHHLDVGREEHASWTPGTGVGTYLIGGDIDRRTTILVTTDGTQEPGFPLKYDAE